MFSFLGKIKDSTIPAITKANTIPKKTNSKYSNEKFYLKGLSIKPDHNGINEYLGELYVQTNRIDKANERLEVLKNCNCKEYGELELIIKTKGSKVY